MKKGQLSVETMIIYGLVILVALSVVGALLYFGVLDLGAYLPNSCNLGGTGELKCEEMKLVSGADAATSEIQLGIRNIGQKPIDTLEVTIEDELGIHFATVGPMVAEDINGNVIDGSGVTLPPGEIAVVTGVPTNFDRSGQLLRGKITTKYKYRDGIVEQEAFGSLRIKAT